MSKEIRSASSSEKLRLAWNALAGAELRGLSTAHEKAMHLHREYGLSLRQVADVLAMKVGAVQRAVGAANAGRKLGQNGRPSKLAPEQEDVLEKMALERHKGLHAMPLSEL